MAIAFGAMTAWLIFQDEIDAIAAEWTAQR
jgi:hypothetical protein